MEEITIILGEGKTGKLFKPYDKRYVIFVTGEIIDENEKSFDIKLTGNYYKSGFYDIWFPKKALIKIDEKTFELAKWYTPNNFVDKAIVQMRQFEYFDEL